MQSEQTEEMSGDLSAVAIGVGLGFVGGLFLGAVLAAATGSFASPLCVYIILHSGFAMAIMGAWIGPALLPGGESAEPPESQT